MYQFETTTDNKENNVIVRIQKDGEKFSKNYIKFAEFDKKKNHKNNIIKKFPIELYEKELSKFNKKERNSMIKLLEDAFLNGYNNESDEDNDAIRKNEVFTGASEKTSFFRDENKELLKKASEDGEKNNIIEIDDGKFTLTPIFNKYQLFYLVGSCGSGKSYLAREIIENYKKLYPKNEVYVISSLQEDETLDKLKYLVRIDPNTFLQEKPNINEFSNSLVLFDDYENFEKKIYDLTIELINSIASTGRHFKINMICIQHNFINYKATRLLLNEMTHCIVYPSSASNHALKYLLGTYCGLDRKQIQEVKKSKSRWVCIYRHHPNMMITQNELKFL